MGKPDTFITGSLFLLTFLMAHFDFWICNFCYDFFSPTSYVNLLCLIRYLDIIKLKIEHYIFLFLGFLIYNFYLMQLSQFESRYDFIIKDLDRILDTIFTNTCGLYFTVYVVMDSNIFERTY